MLRMGFIDDVERVLKQTPPQRQIALFSATMPAEITVAAKTSTADNIRQRYWLVSGMHKLDALTRILEAEPFDGMIIFARTKMATEELAGKLQARGFSAAAINGDLQQQQRERTISQLKDGSIDILVATDVAARGLDVDRISHVVNYDVPTDPESYVHRIGRTGRAGRKGEAILFITPRERGLLRSIERSTRQAVAMLELPTIQAVNNVRVTRFKEKITETLAAGELEGYAAIIESYERENNVPAVEIAAALARMSRGGVPLLLAKAEREAPPAAVRETSPPKAYAKTHNRRNESAAAPAGTAAAGALAARAPGKRPLQAGFATFRVEVGSAHGVKPGNIVGAVANEADLDAAHIGRIEILDTYSLIELPAGLSRKVLTHLQTVQVGGRPLRIREGGEMPPLRGWAREKAAASAGARTPTTAARPHAAATATVTATVKKPRYVSKAERAGGPAKPVRRKAKTP